MAYKIPAQVIRNVLTWGKNHSYDYDSFLKTIRKKDLEKFYSYYKIDDRELSGTKKEMFEQIEICFKSREGTKWI